MNCPLCAHSLEGGELVMVCGNCHKALGGGLALGATGEFKVPTEALLASHTGRETARDDGERPHAIHVCSWCGKLEHEVKKLLGRSGTALCDECVALCVDILDAELGHGWR